jgi:phenylacetate-CoA ligase
LEKGAIGELTLTNISKKAQPLIRYRTADIVEIVDTDTCLCGRRSFRFHVKGRSDDMIVVGGINVFPSAVEMIFSEFLNQLTGEYQIVLETPPPHENISVRVEYRSDLKQEKLKQLKSTLEKVCRNKLGFRPKIELLQQGRLPRGAGKTRRVIMNF